MNRKLYFTIGISGSGKSTYIKNHFKPKVVVSPDNLRKKLTGDISDQSQNDKIWQMVPTLLKKKIEQYGVAVLDATNVDSEDRNKILKNFDKNEVERIAIVFDVDPEEAKKRVQRDLDSGLDRSDVPDYVILNQYKKFKQGYDSIKNQFDKIINMNKVDTQLKKEYIDYIKNIVREEMKAFFDKDVEDKMEKAKYQTYQDMYLIPQSNWKLKKNIPMLNSKGKVYYGKIGEIHKILKVEYDLIHNGEVITECDNETYSIDSDDFRKAFEMATNEKELKIKNETVIKNEIKKLVKIKDYFGKNIKESIEKLEKIILV